MSITKDFEIREMNGKQASQVFYWPADVHQLLSHARSIEAQNEELKAMLKKHEWAKMIPMGMVSLPGCQECNGIEPDHEPDCDLARLAKKT